MSTELENLISQGNQAFGARDFNLAAEAFSKAAGEYESLGDALNAAEMRNNLSVALLQGGNAQEAYAAAAGSDEIFAQAGDIKRQAMAVGNQAAALESMGQAQEALLSYERSANLFLEAGDDEMRSMVLQSAAKLKLKRGKLTDAAITMIGSVESTPKPTLLQRFLKFLLRLKP
jgi:tetratricopeptide (TPR) repeat protein